MTSLLLVDDDPELCELLAGYLENEGFSVQCRHDGKAAAELLAQTPFDLMVLDVMMPQMGGMELLKYLRPKNAIPVLMLTAKGDPLDRILGLELGADDYLAKPCNPRELLARIKAILRRTDSRPADKGPLCVGKLTLNRGNRAGSYDGRKLELTGAEFTVLELLMQSAGEVLSKDQLTEQALGRKLTPYDRSIDVHLSNLRKKIEAAGGPRDLLINIRGAGYQLTVES